MSTLRARRISFYAIPAEVTKELIPQINDHMMGIKGAFNKLRKFIWWYLNFIEKNPEYGSIVLLELKTSKTYISTEAYQAARTFFQVILDIIKEGQEEGVIKREINVYIARSICVGAMEHIIIRWLLKDRKYSLTQYADELIDLLIDALRPLNWSKDNSYGKIIWRRERLCVRPISAT